jgi:hypothetical protein
MKVVEKIKTHILCSVTFFFRKPCRLWDNMENVVEPERPQMTIWSMRFAGYPARDYFRYSARIIPSLIPSPLFPTCLPRSLPSAVASLWTWPSRIRDVNCIWAADFKIPFRWCGRASASLVGSRGLGVNFICVGFSLTEPSMIFCCTR